LLASAGQRFAPCRKHALMVSDASSAVHVQAPASRIFVSQLGVLGQPVLIAFNAADTAIALETKTDEHLVRTLGTLRSAAGSNCCAAAHGASCAEKL